MYRNIIAPVFLIASGAINLFPKTLEPFVNVGIEPITLQTVVGLISIVLAIGLLSTAKIRRDGTKQ